MSVDSMSVPGSADVAVVTVPAALDATTARILWQSVSEAAARCEVVVIDMSATQCCDLHGLTALLMSQRLACGPGDVRLVPSAEICGMLAAGSARRLFLIFRSVAAAAQWPRGRRACGQLLRYLNGLTPAAYAAYADGVTAGPVDAADRSDAADGSDAADRSDAATTAPLALRTRSWLLPGPDPVMSLARANHHDLGPNAFRSAERVS